MDRVLTVPQFLDTVFSIVGHTPNPLYSCLGQRSHLMCFDSMLVIFNGFSIYQLLTETEESRHLYKFPDYILEFLRLPESSNWKRFQNYSRRVLDYDKTVEDIALSHPVFDDIVRTRTSLVILLIRSPALVYVTFIYSNVTRFVAGASPRPF